MDNLVITVSLDSSIVLLENYADVIVLDKGSPLSITKKYKTAYIRSHFSTPGYTPQDFHNEIDNLAHQARRLNLGVEFIDSMLDTDEIVHFEDKLSQYQLFGDYMPRTEAYNQNTDTLSFARPVFKKRLSSRGRDVTWDITKADSSASKWLVQESLDISQELRVYIIRGKVYPTAAVRQHMTEGAAMQTISSRELTEDERAFAAKIAAKCPDLDMVGLDIAAVTDGRFHLMEANRSPGFAKFYMLTGINLASLLYNGGR